MVHNQTLTNSFFLQNVGSINLSMPDAISSGGSRPAYEKEEQEEMETTTVTCYLPTDTPLAIGSTVSGIETVVARELGKDK